MLDSAIARVDVEETIRPFGPRQCERLITLYEIASFDFRYLAHCMRSVGGRRHQLDFWVLRTAKDTWVAPHGQLRQGSTKVLLARNVD